MKKILLYQLSTLLVLLATTLSASAQALHGEVLEAPAKGKKAPLIGANVYWLGTNLSAVSDASGHFHIARSAKSNRLVVSMVGYRSDTLTITSQSEIEIILAADNSLDEVVVRSTSTVIDRASPIHTEIITSKALAKAACCNLSESFETNASVSVSYADAVTGAKQIQMLGLSGSYVQMNVENIPTLRGLATTFGLNYIPGTWVQSIDVGKGAGSVVNGYESMSGAINVELQKPDSPEKLYLNAYVNHFGRAEGNLNLAKQLNKQWSTALLSHASTLQTRVENNGDGFLDLPLYTQVNAINRWKYQTERFMAQFGIKLLHENRQGGQVDFRPEQHRGTARFYGFGNFTNRAEWFSKLAKLYPSKPYKGLGWIVNGTTHDSRSYFGFVNYHGQQNTLYSNLIYQSIINNTNHQFKTGLSYLLDDYRETYKDSLMARRESVPGAFFEYTYAYPETFTLVVGNRVDFHNLFGTMWTPRMHLRYQLHEHTTLRASVGKGFRVANPLAEYYGNLVSSRAVVFKEQLRPEVSWNYGASLTQTFHAFEKHWDLILDYYYTNFQNQVIADMDHPGYLYFYNLEGKSFAHSFQAELNLIPVKRMEIKLAYRLFDVRQTIGKPLNERVLLNKMFVNRDRVLFNIGYALPYDKWKWDLTIQWNGPRRIPFDPVNYEHTTYINMPIATAPAFVNVNAQVSKAFRKWELYVGGENLTNFRQANPIAGTHDPFGKHFDAGMVWGPVVGRMVYVGMRLKIKK
jgi:outer membrane receptor for ferrienterochelin and colicins